MTEIRHFAGWLRSLTGLAAVAGALALSGCGGGSGAPNNFFKSTLVVTPASAVVFPGIPSLLTITGGTGPFQATSSNSTVLPVAVQVSGRNVVLLANNVATDTDISITVQDLGPLAPAAPSQTVVVTVRAVTLISPLTITPNLPDCGTSLCSGQTAVASVRVAFAGDPVRFDAIGSSYAFVTNNSAQPLTSSLTVLSDSTGTASVIVKANVNAPTQVAQMSVTDLFTGQVIVASFTIVQVTDGSTILTVVPDDATITGPFKGVCTSGFAVDYYIYGGTPPYRVTSTFPAGVSLSTPVVNTNGGFFRAVTNGTCVDPLIFSILDATGRQTTAQLRNVEGTEEAPPAPPAALVVTPQVIPTSVGNCNNLSAFVAVQGGTPPYNILQTSAATPSVPAVTLSAAGIATLVFPATPDTTTTYTFVVIDSSNPQKTSPTFAYDCN